MTSVNDAVRAGDLERALGLAESAVRDSPSAAPARMVLADILMLRGDLERAETHLSAALRFDPSLDREIQSCLQLLRAESDRQQVFDAGRTPEFLVPPTEGMRLRLGAIAHLRAGDRAAASELFLRAAECEPELLAAVVSKGGDQQANGAPAAFADWDSRFGSVLEGLTATGKYYWIPLSAVASIELSPIQSLRDLGWRSAVLTFTGGSPSVEPVGNVAFLFIPTRYPGSERSGDGMLRAGVATEWDEPTPGVGLGLGQRVFLHGERSLAAVHLTSIRLGNAESDPDGAPSLSAASESGA
jgi:type VI secretion system protein ImpE